MSARDVVSDTLLNEGCGDGDQCDATARCVLAALAAAGYAVVPLKMTPEQARRSLDGHALADRVREANPAEYERMVAMRKATWRQLVAAMMGEGE